MSCSDIARCDWSQAWRCQERASQRVQGHATRQCRRVAWPDSRSTQREEERAQRKEEGRRRERDEEQSRGRTVGPTAHSTVGCVDLDPSHSDTGAARIHGQHERRSFFRSWPAQFRNRSSLHSLTHTTLTAPLRQTTLDHLSSRGGIHSTPPDPTRSDPPLSASFSSGLPPHLCLCVVAVAMSEFDVRMQAAAVEPIAPPKFTFSVHPKEEGEWPKSYVAYDCRLDIEYPDTCKKTSTTKTIVRRWSHFVWSDAGRNLLRTPKQKRKRRHQLTHTLSHPCSPSLLLCAVLSACVT